MDNYLLIFSKTPDNATMHPSKNCYKVIKSNGEISGYKYGIKNKIKPFVNPKILKFSKKEIAILEGCLSVPDLYGHVTRPAEIDVEAQDRLGKTFKNHYKGLAARIIQHEIDHLNGTLFIDHIHDQNGKLFRVEKDKKGQEHFIEIVYA